jgi:murein DD-endopeptidase MepM/ murein hydrolase activator NlpD
VETNSADVKVQLDGLQIPLVPMSEGKFWGLVPISYMRPPGEAKIVAELESAGKDSKRELSFKVTPQTYSKEVLTVPPKQVDPPKAAIKRIQAESAEIGALYRVHTSERMWDPPFLMPVDNIVTSHFGAQRVYNGKLESAHKGTDFRAAVGLPIKAPSRGVVGLAKELYLTGFTVILDHGYGMYSIYGHMSKLSVKKGEKVKPGQELGLAGATGRASGPHLHWGMVLQNVKVDPVVFTKL